ncbi:MAG: hypothetical protein E6J90_02755 [Deltaproteobacteria bacterium]|nr:MAG: hypothetical protein E6J90_02755 [Deltaproteobacteria bacterium]
MRGAGREQAVGRDPHALDQLVGLAAQRIALDPLQRPGGRDVDGLDGQDVVVAELADRAGDDHVDPELLADRRQAAVLAGALARVAGDRAIDVAPARHRLLVEPVELHAEQGLEPRDQLGVDAERIEPPHRELLIDRLVDVVGAMRGRRVTARRDRRHHQERTRHERGHCPPHDLGA